MTRGPLGASGEVLREHASQHSCEPDAAQEIICPCGGCLAIVCARCREPVFLVLLSDAPCAHARELLP